MESKPRRKTHRCAYERTLTGKELSELALSIKRRKQDECTHKHTLLCPECLFFGTGWLGGTGIVKIRNAVHIKCDERASVCVCVCCVLCVHFQMLNI